MSIHPDTAARFTRLAQVALIASILLGLGLLVRGPVEPAPVSIDVTQPAEPRPDRDRRNAETVADQPTDWSDALTDILGKLHTYSIAVRPNEEPEPEDADARRGEDPEEQPTAAPFPPTWRYLGGVRDERGWIAMLSIGGRQRLGREGDRIDDYTITRIESDHVIFSIAGIEQRLDRTKPQQVQLTLDPASRDAQPRRNPQPPQRPTPRSPR